jgi:Ca2+-binding RTX toxin-like protein
VAGYQGMRALTVALGALVALGAAAGEAGAGTASVSEDGRELRYTTTTDAANSFFVAPRRGGYSFQWRSASAAIAPGRGCMRTSNSELECNAPEASLLVVELGDGDDFAQADGVVVPMVVRAGAGKDQIHAGENSDVVDGGEGNDRVDGDLGRDQLAGGPGSDVLDGIEGWIEPGDYWLDWPESDSMECGAGDDSVRTNGGDVFGGDCERLIRNGTDGPDTLRGRVGPDRLFGFDGHDDVTGRRGNDVVDGGRGWDYLHGNEGDDRVRGGRGSDGVRGGSGNDVLRGGGGRDYLVAADGGDQDRVFCGGDFDVVRADAADVVSRDCERVRRSG